MSMQCVFRAGQVPQVTMGVMELLYGYRSLAFVIN
jgi:hypothetical protein